MKNPEDEKNEVNHSNDESADKQPKETNWNENQQIDEEGSEVDPEDVK